jgi:hypothetical protein
MTEHEIIELSKYYSRQFGGKAEDAAKLMMDYESKLTRISYKDAINAITRMIEDDLVPGKPAARIAVMCRMCGQSARKITDFVPVHCDDCRGSGYIYVPSPKDWTQGRNWNGEYDTVVTCSCENGRRITNVRSLASYEEEFPHWREEYPLRRLERRVMLGYPHAQAALEKFYQDHPASSEPAQETPVEETQPHAEAVNMFDNQPKDMAELADQHEQVADAETIPL